MTRNELAQSFTTIINRAVADVQALARAQQDDPEQAAYAREVAALMKAAAEHVRRFVWE